MPSYNKVILMGHLTRDPEMRFLPNNTAVVNCGLAVNRKWKSDDGTMKEEACFIDFAVFGPRAEAFAKYHRKGGAVMIEGELRLETWDKDGVKRSKHTVRVSDWAFVGGGKPDGDAGDKPQRAEARSAKPAKAAVQDEIPF